MNLLAVDLGASSGRVMHAVWDGRRIELNEIHRFANGHVQKDGGMFWDIRRIVAEVEGGALAAADRFGAIDAMAVDSWAVDYGLVDNGGELMGDPRHYRDERNVKASELALERLGQDRLYRATGIQYLPFNTLFQLYAEWRENPERLEQARSLLLIPDLINFFMTGACRSEFTNATTTQMLTAGTDGWDASLLRDLGLPTHWLPEVVQPGTELGSIRNARLKDLAGFQSTRVLHTASHDTASAVVSVPAGQPNFAYISSGTWSLVGTLVDEPITTPQAERLNFTNEGGVGNYRLLKNVMGLWILQEIQRNLQLRGEASDVRHLIQQASMANPFPFMIDPDHPSLMQPTDMVEQIRTLCQMALQPVPRTTGQLVRGVLESLALKYRLVMDDLEQLTGKHFDVVHIVGGGSQNDLLNQMTANATGRRVVTGPVESSALGNVLMQLVALKEISVSDIQPIVSASVNTRVVEPCERDLWERAYQQFRGIVASRFDQ